MKAIITLRSAATGSLIVDREYICDEEEVKDLTNEQLLDYFGDMGVIDALVDKVIVPSVKLIND